MQTVLRPLTFEFGVPMPVRNRDKEIQKTLMHEYSQPWQRALGGYPHDVLEEAVQRAIEGSQYFPKLQEFKKFVSQISYERNPVKTNEHKAEEKTWRELNEKLFASWFNANRPVFTGTKFTAKLLDLAIMMIYKSDTPQDAEKGYNAAVSSLTRLKHNENASPEDLERLRLFTVDYIVELEKHKNGG